MKIEVDSSGEVTLSEVFNGVGMRTVEGVVYGICQRDSGLEITSPDGTLVGVKRPQLAVGAQDKETFVEIDGRRALVVEGRREEARDGAYTEMCRLEEENKKLRALLQETLIGADCGGAPYDKIEAALAGKTRTPCSIHPSFKEDCGCL